MHVQQVPISLPHCLYSMFFNNAYSQPRSNDFSRFQYSYYTLVMFCFPGYANVCIYNKHRFLCYIVCVSEYFDSALIMIIFSTFFYFFGDALFLYASQDMHMYAFTTRCGFFASWYMLMKASLACVLTYHWIKNYSDFIWVQDMALVQLIAPKFFAFNHPLFKGATWVKYQKHQVCSVARIDGEEAIAKAAPVLQGTPMATLALGQEYHLTRELPAFLRENTDHKLNHVLLRIYKVSYHVIIHFLLGILCIFWKATKPRDS